MKGLRLLKRTQRQRSSFIIVIGKFEDKEAFLSDNFIFSVKKAVSAEAKEKGVGCLRRQSYETVIFESGK